MMFPGAEVASQLMPRSVHEIDAKAANKLNEQLLLEGYSGAQTRKAYRSHCLRFLRFVGKDPASAEPDEMNYGKVIGSISVVNKSDNHKSVRSVTVLTETLKK